MNSESSKLGDAPEAEEKPAKVTPWGFRDYSERAADVSKTLRTWLVAYGVGGPVLFLTRPEVADAIKRTGNAKLITALFLSGVGVQVIEAFLNKWLSWFRAELLWQPANAKRLHYQIADRLHKFIWTDVAADIWALIAFSWGTTLALKAVLAY